ncbi:hypothetical protein D9Q98_008395 [Chlorella vulgaris]|uniref:Uncharacterized protein n=1 Tax=Chlorella vulgaris TaxID=3077 RepID=A0A9D4TGP3_CHLVU|nr:hypothetical protein D9Q98_008395 [Chlorella vulgaris]
MDGLVAYSDSEDEEQQQGNAQQQREQQQQQSGLPQSAAGSVGKLPPPDFGPQPGMTRSQLPPAAQLPLGSKRGHPHTRGPQLPNPMADSKLQRGGGAQHVGSAKSDSKSSVLLPPQLRGRANVTTEDLSVFTKQSQRAAAQRHNNTGGTAQK